MTLDGYERLLSTLTHPGPSADVEVLWTLEKTGRRARVWRRRASYEQHLLFQVDGDVVWIQRFRRTDEQLLRMLSEQCRHRLVVEGWR